MKVDDILNALNRRAAELEDQADRLMRVGDYLAEFPGNDAECLREAVLIIEMVFNIPETHSAEREHQRRLTWPTQ